MTTAQQVAPFEQDDDDAQGAPNTPMPKKPTPEERADCTRWLRQIESARDFDKVARKRYALDRRYARADRTRFRVDVPTAQSYIDVLRSFLYAQDPSVDVLPSGFSQPPPQKEIEAMLVAQQQSSPQQAAPSVPGAIPGGVASIMQAMMVARGAGAAGAVPGLPAPAPTFGIAPANPMQPSPAGANVMPSQTGTDPDSLLNQQVAAMLKPYQQLRDDSKQLADTMELIISSLWKKAQLKRQALPVVNSALTIGLGWLKACWLERAGKDPVIQQQIDDIMENLATMAQTKRAIDSGESQDDDALRAELEQQKLGLEAKVEMVIARGFAIDFIPAEDIQVSTDCRDLSSYRDASWIAHRAFVQVDQAKADYPDIEANISKATQYFRHKITDATVDRDAGSIANEEVTAIEADSYRKGSESQPAGMDTSTQITPASSEAFVCVWEVWNRDSSMVLTFIEGLDVYAKTPFPPNPGTSRYFPFFQYAIGHVDGERHPRSLITRSEKLFDEVNRSESNASTHRSRSVPKTAFNSGQLDEENAGKLAHGGTQEMVAVKLLDPSKKLSDVLEPVAYAPFDTKLYDSTSARGYLEMIWGVQEALSSSSLTPKTATEAQIQQKGSQSRTGYMRSALDEMLNDLAQYTAEVALQKMDVEDVKTIAGPWCLWPEKMGIESMNALIDVTIHAGSTGKPDTAAQQQAWAAILPELKTAIQEIGTLRGSTKEEVADCMEALVEETVRRTGDRVDATAFMPDPPRVPPPPPPPPPPPAIELSAFAGPQIAALTAICADVKGGVITPDAAIALMQIVAPAVPLHLVQQAVAGSAPKVGDPPTQLDTKNVSPLPPPPAPTAIHIHAPGHAGAEATKAPGMMPTPPAASVPPNNHMSPVAMNPRPTP